MLPASCFLFPTSWCSGADHGVRGSPDQARCGATERGGRCSGSSGTRFGAIGLALKGVLLCGMLLFVNNRLWGRDAATVDFDRQVRPILSDNCFTCHGPDAAARQADLRLDLPEGVFGSAESPGVVIPGKKEESELYLRISAEDPEERMPPPSSGKELTREQIELIGRWIDSGAKWQPHWAFVTPQRPPLPDVSRPEWCRNPIDRFILARLEKEGLAPSEEADKVTLLRRVTYDLTGLPPTPDEVDRFLQDDSPDAYEKVVDRLLASPHFGEHRARYWLDVARYGDTHGLHLDNYRSMWPYRDWVIKAFNENKPYDQFIIEQLAGDLLPNATLDQKVASGFNRCNVTTSEGGAIDAEFLVRYAVDRTSTMGTAFMGLTVGCAVCHDHKYDPITQKDFYRMYAYFYSMADPAMDGNSDRTPPIVSLPTPEQATKKAALEEERAAIEKQIREELDKVDYRDPDEEETGPAPSPREIVWIDDEVPAGAALSADGHPWEFVEAGDPAAFSGKKVMRRKAEGLAQHYFTKATQPLVVGDDDTLFVHVYLDPQNPPREIMLQWNDGSWEHRAFWGEDLIEWGQSGSPSRKRIGDLPAAGQWVRLEVSAKDVGLEAGKQINGWAFTQYGGTVYWDAAGIVTTAIQPGEKFRSLKRWEAVVKRGKPDTWPKPVAEILKKSADKRTQEEQAKLRDYFVEFVYEDTRAIFDPLHARRDEVDKQLRELESQIAVSLVSADLPQPREAFVLERGDYEKPREKVEPGVPSVLPPLPPDAPPNRLGLARWLVQPNHPLTARVAVNRFWQEIFGTGLVKTSEDFGTQGERPSHPELLDWLAVEFMESGWNVKHLFRLMVTSATYRQSARVRPELLAKDPENRLLARGPRFRLDAEEIRDTALFVSGLLVDKIGGPSVKPYQPEGLWEAVGYTTSNTAKFVQDHGEKLYRRSLYTFWKRTSPPPGLVLFDAPSREACVMRRARTNTPLQALNLMNDVQYVEAARKMAERLLQKGFSDPGDTAKYGFKLVTCREPKPSELAVLLELYRWQRDYFEKNPPAAEQLLQVGESPRDEQLPARELAAWTMVCNALLNLDETITKP